MAHLAEVIRFIRIHLCTDILKIFNYESNIMAVEVFFLNWKKLRIELIHKFPPKKTKQKKPNSFIVNTVFFPAKLEI